MNIPDLQQFFGTAWWLAITVVVFFLAVLALLLPFFVWRIWKWSYATCQELGKLNVKLDYLVTLLEKGFLRPPDVPADAPQGEFAFSPAAD